MRVLPVLSQSPAPPGGKGPVPVQGKLPLPLQPQLGLNPRSPRPLLRRPWPFDFVAKNHFIYLLNKHQGSLFMTNQARLPRLLLMDSISRESQFSHLENGNGNSCLKGWLRSVEIRYPKSPGQVNKWKLLIWLIQVSVFHR